MSSSTAVLLLRCVKNFRKAFEAADPDTIYDAEFVDTNGRLDDRPSVYELSGGDEFVRAYLEHCAHAPRNPNKAAWVRRGYDVAPCIELAEPEVIERCAFSFIATRHRVVPCGTEERVREFAGRIADRLQAKTTQTFVATTLELRAFLRERAAEADPEWAGYFSTSATWAELAGLGTAST